MYKIDWTVCCKCALCALVLYVYEALYASIAI